MSVDLVSEVNPPVPSSAGVARVRGEWVMNPPQDLYIPPEALQVFLESFEGPLDFLLYLIRAQDLDILDIPVARITHQYLEYIELMQQLDFDLAAEYLLMAAWLGEIKSRTLLPRPPAAPGEEPEDPRAELIRRLQEYDRYRQAAETLDRLPVEGRDFFPAAAEPPPRHAHQPLPSLSLDELLSALSQVLRRADLFESHAISREVLTVRERMTQILDQLTPGRYVPFHELFVPEDGRLGVVVSFMALLELVKEGLAQLVQAAPLSEVHVVGRRRDASATTESSESDEADAEESPYDP